jgi:hypothetical protein
MVMAVRVHFESQSVQIRARPAHSPIMSHTTQPSSAEHTSMEIDTSPTDTDTLMEGDAAAAAALAILGTSAAQAAAGAGQSDAWRKACTPLHTVHSHTA